MGSLLSFKIGSWVLDMAGSKRVRSRFDENRPVSGFPLNSLCVYFNSKCIIKKPKLYLPLRSRYSATPLVPGFAPFAPPIALLRIELWARRNPMPSS